MEANSGSPTGKHVDPLDDAEEDPALAKARLNAYKETLIIQYDPDKGEEENERDFQETVVRFCEYLEPEVERTVRDLEAAEMRRDYSELVERTWLPPDEFGERGDMRSVAISFSNEREKLTSKIGVPGHPAPALERWRERKTIEAKKQDWTAQELSADEILNADYDTVEEEEEAISKLLSQKYVKIEKRKREIHGEEPKKKEEAEKAARATPPSIGSDYAMWDIASMKFPRAQLNFPHHVSQGDSAFPERFGADVFAWQRRDRRRAELDRRVRQRLAAADLDQPVRFSVSFRMDGFCVPPRPAFVLSCCLCVTCLSTDLPPFRGWRLTPQGFFSVLTVCPLRLIALAPRPPPRLWHSCRSSVALAWKQRVTTCTRF